MRDASDSRSWRISLVLTVCKLCCCLNPSMITSATTIRCGSLTRSLMAEQVLDNCHAAMAMAGYGATSMGCHCVCGDGCGYRAVKAPTPDAAGAGANDEMVRWRDHD